MPKETEKQVAPHWEWPVPKSWGWVRISEVADVIGGGTPRTSRYEFWEAGAIPWITPADLSGYTKREISKGARNITQAGLDNSSARLLPARSVLFSSRAPVGYVAIASNPLATNQGFKSFVLNERVVPEFVYFYLQRAKQEITKLASGTTFLEISASKCASIPIPIAPTREQERIVAKLDALLSRVTAGEAAARRALDRLQRYRAAVLHAAVTGELTRDWRKTHKPDATGAQLLNRLLQERRARWEEAEVKRLRTAGKPLKDNKWRKRYPQPETPETADLPNIPKTWTWASADQLTEATRPITYGVIKLGSKVSGGVPILRSSDVRRLELDLDGVKRIARNIADKYRRTYLHGGEVLVTVRGTLGGVIAVPPSCAGYNISREVALLALLEQKASRPIAFFIASDLLQQWLNKRAKGVAYTGINIETLRQLPLPVLPLDEQAQITREVERRLKQAARLESTIQRQFTRASAMRQSLLREAFSGNLVPQDPNDESASVLLVRIKAERVRQAAERKEGRRRIHKSPKGKSIAMQPIPSAETLKAAWLKIGKKPDAKRLFAAAGFAPEQVVAFYEVLRSVPEIREAFESIQKDKLRIPEHVLPAERPLKEKTKPGQFRLVALWLENFKNLKDYEVRFDSRHGLDVVLGWNGTGKSNLFEALVIIFRDLHYWWEKNKWPNEPMAAYHLAYEIEDQLVDVTWKPTSMRRPEVQKAPLPKAKGEQVKWLAVKREDLPLPRFVFGYYSGPTNRLAEHFLPMKRDHYDRLVKAKSDDPGTLSKLLEQRRFFCAETHHAKYVLLAFAYKEDPKITRFLDQRLRILNFESALFIIRRPRWARKGSTAENFWGATGIMLRVMEKLRRFAIAPMVVQQTVSDGYRSTGESKRL